MFSSFGAAADADLHSPTDDQRTDPHIPPRTALLPVAEGPVRIDRGEGLRTENALAVAHVEPIIGLRFDGEDECACVAGNLRCGSVWTVKHPVRSNFLEICKLCSFVRCVV